MENFETIKSVVRSLLETDEKARNSDKYMIFRLLQECIKLNMNFEEFDERFPFNFESLRRVRQKIQEEDPNLRANEEVENFREERREEFRQEFRGRTRGVETTNFVRSRHGFEVFS